MLVGLTFAAHNMLAWVCTTAFGLEVVPEVNMMPAGSNGSAGRCGASAGSPNSESNDSQPWASSSSVGTLSELPSVTTTQPRSGPASATRAANLGWVIAPTHCVWVMK